MTKSRDRLPDGLSPLKHSFQVRPAVAIAGQCKLSPSKRLPRLAGKLSTPAAQRNVASIVKAGALRLGFDPATFGGHSLRAGFVTSAVKRGANLIKITDVTGHRSLEMWKT
jgi:integrase